MDYSINVIPVDYSESNGENNDLDNTNESINLYSETSSHVGFNADELPTSEYVEPSTRIIQVAYTLCNTLDDLTRSELIENILDSYLNVEVLLPTSKICSIALEICTIFPDEEMGVYYSEACGKRAAGGRLFNRYHAKLKKMRKKSLFPKSTRAINKIRKIEESQEREEIYILSEKERNSIEYLLQHKFRSVDDLAEHWRITSTYRQNLFKNTTEDVKAILDYDCKALKLSVGHNLICEDFKILHGFDKAASLRLQWKNIFDANKLELLKKKVKNLPTLRTINKLPLTDEYVNVSTIFLLNAILIPPLQQHRKRPTIKDAQDSILMFAKTNFDLQQNVRNRFEGEFKMDHHPIIVVMEPIDENIYFMVIFHNLKYRFHRLSDAIDVCFKMFVVFFIDFSIQSIQFYSFLNEMFYNINLKIGKSPKVLMLVKYLKDSNP